MHQLKFDDYYDFDEKCKKWPESLRFLLEVHEMKEQDLAFKVGCTFGAINHYLHGRRFPKMQIMKKIAAYFKIDESELLSLPEKRVRMLSKKLK